MAAALPPLRELPPFEIKSFLNFFPIDSWDKLKCVNVRLKEGTDTGRALEIEIRKWIKNVPDDQHCMFRCMTRTLREVFSDTGREDFYSNSYIVGYFLDSQLAKIIRGVLTEREHPCHKYFTEDYFIGFVVGKLKASPVRQ